jgi:hypothetical protein
LALNAEERELTLKDPQGYTGIGTSYHSNENPVIRLIHDYDLPAVDSRPHY